MYTDSLFEITRWVRGSTTTFIPVKRVVADTPDLPSFRNYRSLSFNINIVDLTFCCSFISSICRTTSESESSSICQNYLSSTTFYDFPRIGSVSFGLEHGFSFQKSYSKIIRFLWKNKEQLVEANNSKFPCSRLALFPISSKTNVCCASKMNSNNFNVNFKLPNPMAPPKKVCSRFKCVTR